MWRFLLLFLTHTANSSKEWDILIFTQHWPSTVCLQYEESGPSHVCARTKNPFSWTIHGVWPTKLHTLGPGFCDPANKFEPSLVNKIEEELVTTWPNLEAGKGEASLWAHEWEKHGTCAVSLPSLNSEEKYFRKGIEWFNLHNMTTILAKGGIYPSDTKEYHVEAIRDAVVMATGINPNIQCVLEKHSKKPYLFEIRICFDKNLTLTDCDGTRLTRRSILTNCPLDSTVRYPLQVPVPSPKPSSPQEPKRRNRGQLIRDLIEVLTFLDWVI